MGGHDFGSRDRLDRLAESHLVGQEAAARAAGEERALALVGVERHAKESLEGGALGPVRKRLGQTVGAATGVADLPHEPTRVLVTAQLVREPRGLDEEGVQPRHGLWPQPPVPVEVPRGQPAERGRGGPARAEADLAPRPVADVDLAVVGLEPTSERRAAARRALQPGQREGDVLADPEGVRGEVGARAEVVPRSGPANGYPVRVAVRRVDDLELREHALAADVGQPEPLLAPELAPQLRLPRFQREARWPVRPRQPGRPAARGTVGGHGSHRRCAAVKLHGTPSKGRRSSTRET